MNFSELIKQIVTKQVILDMGIPDHLSLIKKIYGTYYAYKQTYEKMYRYYNGDTDAMRKYLFVTERSNLKINANFIKKFIKEEVSYTVGNPITYESRKGDSDIINDIEYYTAHWDELHDTNLMKYLLIQNTLDRYVDTMYQIACHINHNEKMQSNLSGIALRSRLIALENKCKLEEKAHKNIIKSRLKFLCMYLNLKKKKNYDYKDIKIKALYTPNIPQDDLTTAQMLNQLPEGIVSKDTGRGLFSFIHNKSAEGEKVKKDQRETWTKTSLDKAVGNDG